MKRRMFFLAVVVSLLCGEAFCADSKNSGDSVVVRQVKGHGQVRAEAIRDALYQAVAQARGVRVGSDEYDIGFDSVSVTGPRRKKGARFDAASVRAAGTTNRAAIDGLVKTYEVLDEKKIDENTYEVTLSVSVQVYEAPEKTRRVKLAVMPLRVVQEYYRFGELKMISGQLSGILSQKLNSLFTNTNKFAVLDREYIQSFSHEKDILLSDDAPIVEKAKLGMVLGADYVLAGTISRAQLRRRKLRSQAVGRTIYEYEADFVFDYRLIVSATRRVSFSDTVTISLETDQVRKLVKRWRPDNLDYSELVENLAARVANLTIESVCHPIINHH